MRGLRECGIKRPQVRGHRVTQGPRRPLGRLGLGLEAVSRASRAAARPADPRSPRGRARGRSHGVGCRTALSLCSKDNKHFRDSTAFRTY